jgi:hypothetical protein
MTVFTAQYRMDRVFGGPEEGGWWYNTGQRQKEIQQHQTEEKAYAFINKKNEEFKKDYTGRGLSSMAYNHDFYRYMVFHFEPPKHFPEERPYYE